MSELKAEFSSSNIDWSLCEDAFPWWYVEKDEANYVEWRPYGEGQWYAVPGEPQHAFESRMEKLNQWLHQRPEKVILYVGHWAVLQHFTGEAVKNCGVCCMELVSKPALVG